MWEKKSKNQGKQMTTKSAKNKCWKCTRMVGKIEQGHKNREKHSKMESKGENASKTVKKWAKKWKNGWKNRKNHTKNRTFLKILTVLWYFFRFRPGGAQKRRHDLLDSTNGITIHVYSDRHKRLVPYQIFDTIPDPDPNEKGRKAFEWCGFEFFFNAPTTGLQSTKPATTEQLRTKPTKTDKNREKRQKSVQKSQKKCNKAHKKTRKNWKSSKHRKMHKIVQKAVKMSKNSKN